MSAQNWQGLAQIALTKWRFDPPATLISHRENAVFEVRQGSGEKAALRLHRPGYNSIAEIKAELWWTRALAARNFAVPTPISTPDGDFLVRVSDSVVATVLSWADGQAIGQSGVALDGTLDRQTALYADLGELLARLHTQSDAIELPRSFARRHWDIYGFLGPNPLWGRFWENPALDKASSAMIETARDKARVALSDYAKTGGDFGLIHADALRENVFAGDRGLTLIDFDDSGFGFRLYDLATALSQSYFDDNYDQLRGAILRGYGRRRQVSDADRRMFTLFAMLRTFASLGWAVPRLGADDPAMSIYVRRATTAAARFLEERATTR